MTLLEVARFKIKEYLSTRPNLSITTLARKCDMPASTARSIIQGEIKRTRVENITALLSTFLPLSEVLELVKTHGESEGFWSGMAYAALPNSCVASTNEPFEWENPDHLILALASLPGGLDTSKAIRYFGQYQAQTRIEALLEAGFLREINGKLKHPQDYLVFSLRDSRKRAILHAQGWNESEATKGEGWLFHTTQNYTAEGHMKAKELARKFHNDLLALEQEYAGGDKILVFSMLASLLTEDSIR